MRCPISSHHDDIAGSLAGTFPIALGWEQAPNHAGHSALLWSADYWFPNCFTLYITPVFYLYMERFTKKLSPTPVPTFVEETPVHAL